MIITHGREAQKRLNTGRLSHLFLQDSLYFRGHHFSGDARIQGLLQDPNYAPCVLFPEERAWKIDQPAHRQELFHYSADKKLLILVIDGTWITARKTVERSHDFTNIPKICFTPSAPSQFRVREQPEEICLASVEAIHQCIELLTPNNAPCKRERAHDQMLQTFSWLVDQHIQLRSTFAQETRSVPKG